MSGIHLLFSPDGFDQAARDAFRDRVARRTTRVPGEPVDFLFGPHLCAAVSHHGVLPTGGVVERDGSRLAAWGSAWIRPEDTGLSNWRGQAFRHSTCFPVENTMCQLV